MPAMRATSQVDPDLPQAPSKRKPRGERGEVHVELSQLGTRNSAGQAIASPAPFYALVNIAAPSFDVRGFMLHPQAAATLMGLDRRRPLAVILVGGRRSRRDISGGRATKTLSNWTDFDSALAAAVVVFVVPGLSRGNSPGDTERNGGKGNQHLLPTHVFLFGLNASRLCGGVG